MDVIEKKISSLIESQFPAFYREEGPMFVAFVKKYYEWMETQGQSNYYNRRFFELHDIDETTDDFLVYFKETYMKNIQLETTTATRQFIKHSLDLYRSKGTERSIDLLFRLVFGFGAEVYYPGEDIFRLSDGRWLVPRYIEVSLNEENYKLVGKQVTGLTSGATAFAESVIRRTVGGRLIDIIYISAINGNFETGELINTADRTIAFKHSPTMLGSLTGVVTSESGTGTNFVVGDIVTVTSEKGKQAKARVSAVSSITGLLSLELINGGYGYSYHANVLISEKVLTLSNVVVNTAQQNFWLNDFEILSQPMANLNYLNATMPAFTVGQSLYTKYPNNDVKGTGQVLAVQTLNSTAGELQISVLTGSMQDNAFYVNTSFSANQSVVNGYYDSTATGNVIGISNTVVLKVTGITGTFQRLEYVSQTANGLTVNGALAIIRNVVGTNATFVVEDSIPLFRTSTTITGLTSGATATVATIDIDVGVIDITGGFSTIANNYAKTDSTNATGTITAVSTGDGASFGFSNDFLYSESLELNTDFLAPYANIALDAADYGFPAVGTDDLSTIIDDSLTTEVLDIGKIGRLTAINGGSGYNKSPIIRVFDQYTYPYRNRDQFITITGAAGGFSVGEVINQSATGGRGLVKTANSSVIKIERLRVLDENDFVATVNATTIIVGEDSAATANVVSVTDDPTSFYIGINAIIDNDVQTGNGAITSLEVMNSGFGYVDGEQVDISLGENIGSGFAEVKSQGKGDGYHKRRGGELSGDKHIFDGSYYQEYSYEVRAPLTLSRYEEMLKQVVHTAGTKFFAAFVHKAIADAKINIQNATIEIS